MYFNQDMLVEDEDSDLSGVSSQAYCKNHETVRLRDEAYYSPLEEILKDVNVKCVKIDEESRKRNVEISLEVVREIIDMLKESNPVFKQIYTRTEFVGSYFDGLRVKNATEFDLNIILKLPLNYNKIKNEAMLEVAASEGSQVSSDIVSTRPSRIFKRPQQKADHVLQKIAKRMEQPIVASAQNLKQPHYVYREHIAEKLRSLPPALSESDK